MPEAKPVRQRLDERFAALKTERTPREDEWRLIQRLVIPRRGRLNLTEKTSGRERHKDIVNNTASVALRTMVHGLAANIINPASPWFRLAPEDDDLAEYGPVREWLAVAEERLSRILMASGFYGHATTTLWELGGFGTGALAEERDFETVVRWHPWTCGEYFLATDARGKATTCYREWQMTAEAIIATFGLARVSPGVKQAYDSGNLDQKFTVRHAIEPYSDRFASLPGLRRWRYVSIYWEPASQAQDNALLMAGGHHGCPVHAPRWEHVPPDPYGNSPMMDALGDVAGLQIAEKKLVKGIERKMGKGFQGPPSTAGMSPTEVDGDEFIPVPGAQGEIKPLIDPGRIQLSDAEWYHAKLEDRIRKTLFNDLFLMFLNLDRREMTATETMERAREKLLLGPVLHNINAELLNPVIDGLLDTMFRESLRFWQNGEAGMLPPPPQELQGANLKIDYISELQQAQRMTKAEPVYRLGAFVGQYAQIDPTMVMKFDWSQAVDELGNALGVPPKVVRDDETVAQMMAEQAQAQQAAQAQQDQLAQSQVIKNLGTAKSEPGTALGDLAQEAA